MKIIITEQQDEKLTRRVKMMVEKLGLKDAIKMFGDNTNIIKHAYENNLLDYLNNFKDLEVVESEKYPNSIFFKKNGVVVMQQDMKYKRFWFDYDNIWSFFESFFGMKYQQIQGVLKQWLEETLNLEGYTPAFSSLNILAGWKRLST